MAEMKTKKTQQSVEEFLAAVDDQKRAQDARVVTDLMQQVTGQTPRMWGPSIIGFGDTHYKYESGREGDFFVMGLSPRKQNLVLYLVDGAPAYGDLLKKLGKHKTGKSCLYVNKLSDIDLSVLKEMLEKSNAMSQPAPSAPPAQPEPAAAEATPARPKRPKKAASTQPEASAPEAPAKSKSPKKAASAPPDPADLQARAKPKSRKK